MRVHAFACVWDRRMHVCIPGSESECFPHHKELIDRSRCRAAPLLVASRDSMKPPLAKSRNCNLQPQRQLCFLFFFTIYYYFIIILWSIIDMWCFLYYVLMFANGLQRHITCVMHFFAVKAGNIRPDCLWSHNGMVFYLIYMQQICNIPSKLHHQEHWLCVRLCLCVAGRCRLICQPLDEPWSLMD